MTSGAEPGAAAADCNGVTTVNRGVAMPRPRVDASSRAGRDRLAALCEGALSQLRTERAAAPAGERDLLDSQIETFRDMLHWARSKH